jgi:regulator of PEP synthase PpsR (kinase-PPPase family)
MEWWIAEDTVTRGKPAKKVVKRTGTKARRGKGERKAVAKESETPQRVEPMVLHILSDSTGNLAQHMVTAVLTQFPEGRFRVRRHNFLQNEAAINSAMDEVAKMPGLVIHAVVSPAAKAVIERRCREIGVVCHDLTGPFVTFLTRESWTPQRPDVQRLHDVSDEYHQRINALEFTLEHDDGLRVETVGEADIVLTGVSRTSKTPTSIYLAQQGYRVANVPLTLGVEPPAQLMQMRPGKVVGLVIDPRQLVEIRTTRLHQWHMSSTEYNDEDVVAREVAWTRQLFAGKGWPILDVTGRAVEETAARVINLLGLGGSAG